MIVTCNAVAKRKHFTISSSQQVPTIFNCNQWNGHNRGIFEGRQVRQYGRRVDGKARLGVVGAVFGEEGVKVTETHRQWSAERKRSQHLLQSKFHSG